MLALVLSAAPSLHTPGVNARLSNRANARSSARMITLVDEVDEKAMLVASFPRMMHSAAAPCPDSQRHRA